MLADKPIDLPAEFQFDVAQAVKYLATLAETEPESVIVVTLAELNAEGLGAESDIYLSATCAAALLATVTENQPLSSGGRNLVALRVARAKDAPARATQEPWNQDQTR